MNQPTLSCPDEPRKKLHAVQPIVNVLIQSYKHENVKVINPQLSPCILYCTFTRGMSTHAFQEHGILFQSMDQAKRYDGL